MTNITKNDSTNVVTLLIVALIALAILTVCCYLLLPIYKVSWQSIQPTTHSGWGLLEKRQSNINDIDYEGQYSLDVTPDYGLKQKSKSARYSEKQVFDNIGFIQFHDYKDKIDVITLTSLIIKIDGTPQTIINTPTMMPPILETHRYSEGDNLQTYEHTFTVATIPKNTFAVKIEGIMVNNENKKIPFSYANQGNVKTTVYRSSNLDRLKMKD